MQTEARRPLPWSKCIPCRIFPVHTRKKPLTVWNRTSQPFPVLLPCSLFTLASLSCFQEISLHRAGLLTFASFIVNNSFHFSAFLFPSTKENTEPGCFFCLFSYFLSCSLYLLEPRSKLLLCLHSGRKAPPTNKE